TKYFFRATRTSGQDRGRGRFWPRQPGRRHELLRWVRVFYGRSRLGVLANPRPWASHRSVPIPPSLLRTSSFRIFCSSAFSAVRATSDFLRLAAPRSAQEKTVSV